MKSILTYLILLLANEYFHNKLYYNYDNVIPDENVSIRDNNVYHVHHHVNYNNYNKQNEDDSSLSSSQNLESLKNDNETSKDSYPLEQGSLNEETEHPIPHLKVFKPKPIALNRLFSSPKSTSMEKPPTNVKYSKNRIDYYYDNYPPPKGVDSINNLKTPKAGSLVNIHKQYFKPPTKVIGNVNSMPPTPKANSLKNHWGTDKLYNIYGPKGMPYNLQQFHYLPAINPYHYKTIAKNYYQENPLKDPLRDEPLPINHYNVKDKPCINELNKYYPYCSMYNNDCNSCVGTGSCVYSYYKGKCLPGDQAGDSCRTLKVDFAAVTRQCAMQFNNVFPNSKTVNRFVGKLGAIGAYQNEIDYAGKERVVSGSFGNLSVDSYDTKEPFYVNKLDNNGYSNLNNWHPTMNSNYDVISGKISGLSNESKKLITPDIPTVMTNNNYSEPFYVNNIPYGPRN